MLYNLYTAPWGVAIIIAIIVLSFLVLVSIFISEAKTIFCREPKVKDINHQNCPN